MTAEAAKKQDARRYEALLKRGKPLAEHAAILAFFAIAAAYLVGNVVFSGHITADVGFDDRLFDARLMRYEFDWLMGRTTGGLFDIDFFFPHPNALATTDPEFGIMLVTLPFRIFTDDYLLLTNLAAYVSFALVGHASFLLATELTGSKAAGIFAGVAFSFCQYRFHQIDHTQILQMQWLIYGLFSLHRLGKAPGPRWAAAVLGFVFLHGVSGFSLGLYSMPIIPVVALWVAFSAEPSRRLHVLAWAAAAGAIACAALYPFYRPFLINREVHAIVRSLDEVRMYSGKVEQLWAVPHYNRMYGPRLSDEMGRESMTFPGIAVLVFGVLGLAMRWPNPAVLVDVKRRWRTIGLELFVAFGKAAAVIAVVLACLRWRDLTWIFCFALVATELLRRSDKTAQVRSLRTLSPVWVYALLGLVYLLISFGPEVMLRGERLGSGVWDLVTKVPGYAQVRTPARFYFVTSLAAALIAAAGLKGLLQFLPGLLFRRVFVAGVVAFTFAEMAVRIPERRMVNAVNAPPIYQWLKDQPGKRAIVELPIQEARERYRMYYANIHKRPTVGAESSFHLPSLAWMTPHGLFSNPNQGLVNLQKLKTAGLEFLVLHTREGHPNLIQAHRDLMTAAGASLYATVEADEVWRFPEAPAVLPFKAEHLTAQLQLPQSLSVNGLLNLSVLLAPRAGPVFEQTHRKLFVQLKGLPLAEGKTRFPVHLAPPLLLSGRTEAFPLSIPTLAPAGVHPIKVDLVDEQGNSWASQELSVEAR